MDYINYYKTLGVEEGASKKEIGKAYRKLARQYHPDRNKTPGAEGEFKRISEAYAVLKDEEKRAQYDRYGAEWETREQSGAPFNSEYSGNGQADWGQSGFSTFFEQLFGASGRRSSRDIFADIPRESFDQEAVLPLSVQEGYKGGRRQISLQDPHAGKQRTYAVNVPAGVRNGQRIRLAGQGAIGTDGRRGHLYLKVQLSEGGSGDLRLEGTDVYSKLDIMPWTAALGGKVRLETLDGTVEVKVPAGSSSGRRIRLRGRGYIAEDGSRGDLYAELRIVVPEHLSSEQQQLFEKLTQLAA